MGSHLPGNKKKVTKLGVKCANILAVHALSGCDTVSFLFGRGKRKAVNVLQKNDDLNLQVFGDPEATRDQIVTAGRKFLLLCTTKRSRMT